MPDDKPEIFIDEDWKSQVEKEREQERATQASDEEQSKDGSPSPEELAAAEKLTLFDHLISTLAAQTTISLGLVAEEGQEKVYVDLDLASHLIQTLIMLQEKTAGNLDEDEKKNLDEAAAELQRVFGVRVEQMRTAQINQPSIDPNPSILDG